MLRFITLSHVIGGAYLSTADKISWSCENHKQNSFLFVSRWETLWILPRRCLRRGGRFFVSKWVSL